MKHDDKRLPCAYKDSRAKVLSLDRNAAPDASRWAVSIMRLERASANTR